MYISSSSVNVSYFTLRCRKSMLCLRLPSFAPADPLPILPDRGSRIHNIARAGW